MDKMATETITIKKIIRGTTHVDITCEIRAKNETEVIALGDELTECMLRFIALGDELTECEECCVVRCYAE